MVGSANLKDIASRNFSKKYWNDTDWQWWRFWYIASVIWYTIWVNREDVHGNKCHLKHQVTLFHRNLIIVSKTIDEQISPKDGL